MGLTLPVYAGEFSLRSQRNVTLAFVATEAPVVQTAAHQTYGRSEEWKQNVIRNAAQRIVRLKLVHRATHTLYFQALDEGVLLDQVLVFSLPSSPERITGLCWPFLLQSFDWTSAIAFYIPFGSIA